MAPDGPDSSATECVESDQVETFIRFDAGPAALLCARLRPLWAGVAAGLTSAVLLLPRLLSDSAENATGGYGTVFLLAGAVCFAAAATIGLLVRALGRRGRVNTAGMNPLVIALVSRSRIAYRKVTDVNGKGFLTEAASAVLMAFDRAVAKHTELSARRKLFNDGSLDAIRIDFVMGSLVGLLCDTVPALERVASAANSPCSPELMDAVFDLGYLCGSLEEVCRLTR